MSLNEDRWRIFEIHRNENENLKKDASNNFDKAILVLSAAAIGLMPQIIRGNSVSNFHCLVVVSIWFFFYFYCDIISFFYTYRILCYKTNGI